MDATYKKESMEKIAKRHNLHVRTIRRYRDEGINIYDDDAIELHRKYTIVPDAKDNDYLSMEASDLKKEKLIADTKLKKAQAAIAELNLKKTKGSLVTISDVEEVNLAIAGKIKAQLKRLISEIPPRVEGLDATTMTPIIREYIEDILKYLYEEFKIDDVNEEEETVT